jgi:hypothetical protein
MYKFPGSLLIRNKDGTNLPYAEARMLHNFGNKLYNSRILQLKPVLVTQLFKLRRGYACDFFKLIR